MSKSAIRVTLPHLTPDELSERDSEESLLNKRLRACMDRDDFDSERAMHVLHSSAIEIFKIMNSAYLKRPQYKPEWKDEIISVAVFRALYSSFDYVNKYALHEYRGSDDPVLDVADELKNAVREHIEATATHLKPIFTPPDAKKRPSVFESLTGREAAGYASAGIDLAAASPLLLMVHESAQKTATQAETSVTGERSPLAERRRTTVQPLLDGKGWSWLEWSAEAKVAYHTVADYMAGKRKQYPSTRKKLADSLGISIQQLPK